MGDGRSLHRPQKEALILNRERPVRPQVNEKLEWHVTTSLEIEDIRAALANGTAEIATELSGNTNAHLVAGAAHCRARQTRCSTGEYDQVTMT
jgi:hypothetical protein